MRGIVRGAEEVEETVGGNAIKGDVDVKAAVEELVAESR